MALSHFTFHTIFPQLAPIKIPTIRMPVAKMHGPHEPTSGAAQKRSTIIPQFQITDEFYTCHELKLKQVRNTFSTVEQDSLESLVMVDALQRLGIDYHFQEEIEHVTRAHFITFDYFDLCNHNLYEISLRFRLLRQEGLYVPADVFNNFKNYGGKMEPIAKDIKGLMELYEASQLSTIDECILDEAGAFSYRMLNEWMTNLEYHQANIVANTLRNPYHKSLAKFMVKSYIDYLSVTNSTSTYMNALVELAKMDLNIVQSIYQKEIIDIIEWWKDIGLAKELKFARDQPIKWYMWAMAILTDPSLSQQRLELTKPISLVYIIDDIFDVRGTLDELTLFTEAVNRWELDAIEHLADDMKICFRALYDTTNEISHKIYCEHGWNPINSLRKAWARLCNAFLLEAKWIETGNYPKAEEYVENAIVTSGVHVAMVHVFFLMNQGIITKAEVELWDDKIPDIVLSTATILRLFDDLGSAKDENQDGRDGSYVKIYMKENPDMSVQVARKHVMEMLSDTWKRLNHQFFSPNQFSPCFNKACLNAARMTPLMYSYKQQNLPSLEENIKSILFGS